jgi:hypothetical protein
MRKDVKENLVTQNNNINLLQKYIIDIKNLIKLDNRNHK